MSTNTIRKFVVGGVLLVMGVGFVGTAMHPLFATKAKAPSSKPISFVVESQPAVAAPRQVEMPNPLPPISQQAQQRDLEQQVKAVAPHVKKTPKCQALLSFAQEVLNGDSSPSTKQDQLALLRQQASKEKCL